MKGIALSSLVAWLIAMAIGAIADAHFPEGMTFYAFQWPPGQEPVLDGVLSEWELVPDTYIVNTEQYTPLSISHRVFTDIINMEDAPLRYQFAVVWTSWSPSENALYVAARVFDDDPVKRSGSAVEWAGDQFEVMVDADHSGGIFGKIDWLERPYNKSRIKREFWDTFSAQATTYRSEAGASVPFVAWTAATWASEPPWFEGAYEEGPPVPEAHTNYELRWLEELRRVRFEQAGLHYDKQELPIVWWDAWWGAMTTYELKIVAFDWIDWRGPGQSVVHMLREGKIIGLNYAFTDAIPGSTGDEMFSYRVLSGQCVSDGKQFSASKFSDFLLAPVDTNVFEETSVQSSTWGRIKANFRRGVVIDE